MVANKDVNGMTSQIEGNFERVQRAEITANLEKEEIQKQEKL